MSGLFDGTRLERPVTCARCAQPLDRCRCPRNAAGEIVLPANQPVRVRREKRSGGKVATVITGFDSAATDLPSLLSQLKTRFAAGGTIRDGHIEIQGDHREQALSFLKELGYPAKQAGG